MMCIRVGIVVAAFVLCYQGGGILVALVASLALLVMLGPTVILLGAVRSSSSGEAPKQLVQLVYRTQLPVAVVLLVVSIFTRLSGLIILCVLTTLMAALTSLMMWAARQDS